MKSLTLAAALLLVLGVSGCGGGKHGRAPVGDEIPDYSDTHVYDPNSPYQNVLKKCIQASESQTCTLAELPLLNQEAGAITKEKIMQRLVVSHDWMAVRFSQLLDRYQDKGILPLFGAVTAVVIDDDINPSYYDFTGAIHLEPELLWLTQDEKKTINTKSDFRNSYAQALSFEIGETELINGNSIFSSLDKQQRSLDDIEMPFASVLYHELSHANDAIPRAYLDKLDNSKPIADNINSFGTGVISKQLYGFSPLESTQLKALGKVLYHGQNASEEIKQMSAIEIGDLFDDDRAPAMYAYSDRFEDMAMLFEVSMMKYYYNVDFATVVISKTGDEQWGIVNAFLRENVIDRAIFVANQVEPVTSGWSERLHAIPASVQHINFNTQKSRPSLHAFKKYKRRF